MEVAILEERVRQQEKELRRLHEELNHKNSETQAASRQHQPSRPGTAGTSRRTEASDASRSPTLFSDFPVTLVGTPPSMQPLYPSEGQTATALDGSVYLFGGTNGATIINDMVKYTVSTARWKRVTPSSPSSLVPSARYGHSSVVHNGRIVVYGGYGPGGTPQATEAGQAAAGGSSGLLSSMFIFDPRSGDWSAPCKSADACGPTKNHTAVSFRGRMYVFGGCLVEGRTNALRVHDLETHLWLAPEQLNQQAIAANTTSTDSATTLLQQAEVPSPRSGHSAIVATRGAGEAGMYIFGGRTGKFAFSNKVYRYDFNSKQWARVFCGGAVPSPRCDHTAVVYKDQMIVFGGYALDQDPDNAKGSTKSYFNDVHVLNLVSCTWSRIELSGQKKPLGCCGHSSQQKASCACWHLVDLGR